MGRFDSTLEKLRWADVHREALDRMLAEFGEGNPVAVSYERQREGLEHVLTVRQVPQVPRDVALEFGDCLFNLRATLDHLIRDAAVLGGAPPRLAFPVVWKAPKKKGQRLSGLDGVPPREVAFTESLQPYNAPHTDPSIQWISEGVWLLHELNNWDKHNAIHLVGQATSLVAARSEDRVAYESVGPLEAGAEILRVVTSTPDDMTVETRSKLAFVVDIAIDQQHPSRLADVAPLLASPKSRVLLDLLYRMRSAVGDVLDYFQVPHVPLPLEPVRPLIFGWEFV